MHRSSDEPTATPTGPVVLFDLDSADLEHSSEKIPMPPIVLDLASTDQQQPPDELTGDLDTSLEPVAGWEPPLGRTPYIWAVVPFGSGAPSPSQARRLPPQRRACIGGRRRPGARASGRAASRSAGGGSSGEPDSAEPAGEHSGRRAGRTQHHHVDLLQGQVVA